MCDYCNNEKSIISIEDTYEDGYTGIDRYENGDVYINGNELNLSCDVEVIDKIFVMKKDKNTVLDIKQKQKGKTNE